MMDFWPMALLLILLALMFVVIPLLMNSGSRGVGRAALNLDVARDQLDELRADLEAGRLAEADYAAARHDLERQLLDDLGEEDGGPGRSDAGGRWLLVVVLVLMPVMAVGIYQQLGTPQADQLKLAAPPVPADVAGAPHSVEDMIAALAAKLEANPDDPEGWYMLGRSYAAINRYTAAADAYRRAIELVGDDAELLSSYADLLVMTHNGEFNDEVGELLNRAIKADPGHAKSRWLLGHWKARRGDTGGAVEQWQLALAALPPGSDNATAIQRQISELQGRRNPVAEPAPVTASSAARPGGSIEVKVELDPALRARVDSDDTLFIFARPTGGARMPLAVVRKRVADLPLQVTLDDSLAMSPAMVLSGFEQVTVSARVSKSGQARPASGDLEGSLSPVVVGGEPVQLLIDRVLP